MWAECPGLRTDAPAIGVSIWRSPTDGVGMSAGRRHGDIDHGRCKGVQHIAGRVIRAWISFRGARHGHGLNVCAHAENGGVRVELVQRGFQLTAFAKRLRVEIRDSLKAQFPKLNAR